MIKLEKTKRDQLIVWIKNVYKLQFKYI